MEIQEDFKELLELFNYHKVEYVIVGGYALAFHGAPRYTGDIDLYVRPTNENAEKILKILDDFGFGDLELEIEDLNKENQILQLGVPPVRIDIITSVSGVSWDEIDSGSVAGKYGEITVRYIGIEEFIKNKKTTGRKKDLADIENLDHNFQS